MFTVSTADTSAKVRRIARESDEMVLRYLGAFGPATVSDVRTWSRLTGLQTVIERLRPRLRTFRDEHGRELFDLPDAPLPDPDASAPARFLPRFDNALLSHADRIRIIGDEHRKRIIASGGMGSVGTVLFDGFVCGTWKTEHIRNKATLVIEPFETLPKEHRDALAEEGERLVRFMTGSEGGETPEVRYVETT